VLGICRGMQLINVAYGGSLHQDLVAGGATRVQHVMPSYDEHAHALAIAEGSWLAGLYPDSGPHQVNSIHHQGVHRLGRNLSIQAWSDDGIPECLRADDAEFVVGVQWHPEFHDRRFPSLMSGEPLLRAFLAAAGRRRENQT
jgi:putative glutamine amidotransferase